MCVNICIAFKYKKSNLCGLWLRFCRTACEPWDDPDSCVIFKKVLWSKRILNPVHWHGLAVGDTHMHMHTHTLLEVTLMSYEWTFLLSGITYVSSDAGQTSHFIIRIVISISILGQSHALFTAGPNLSAGPHLRGIKHWIVWGQC